MLTVINDICYFLIENNPDLIYQFCNTEYNSIRLFENFRNNLLWQNFILKYLEEPKNIYENKMVIYYMTKRHTINKKYVKIERIAEFINLLSIQYFVALVIEIVDFVLPKIYDLLCYFGQLVYFVIKNLQIYKYFNKKVDSKSMNTHKKFLN
uniref:Conserved hypothetical plastid protein n=1 Tax=Flintiella sanguinaria TaxID=101926 RepID=A0A1X9PUA6_9RHOD|nr:conserved hypothetical plastid protein [Flintiella sanguinaria]